MISFFRKQSTMKAVVFTLTISLALLTASPSTNAFNLAQKDKKAKKVKKSDAVTESEVKKEDSETTADEANKDKKAKKVKKGEVIFF